MKKKNLLLTLMASLGFAITIIGQIPANIPTNGLLGWWPFNGNAIDESGNAIATLVDNGASLTSDRYNNENSAYFFDGIDDRIRANDVTSLYSDTLTISYWIKMNSNSAGTITLGSPSRSQWSAYASQNQLVFDVNVGCSGGSQLSFSANDLITLNEWHHLVFILKGLSKEIYLDGNIIGGNTNQVVNCTPNSENYFLYFGVEIFSQPEYFHGSMDDIAIWDRILTFEEIILLYETCSSNLVLTQPTDQNTTIGNNVIFTTTANDQDATFQWQSDLGLDFQNVSNTGQYSGATTNELTVSNVSTNNNNQPFRCIISSSACNDTTNLATLTVGTTFLDENTLNSIKISPNPTKDYIFVEGNTTNEDFQIIDIKGTVLITTNSNKIDLKKLSSGQYFLKQGSRYSKFIKE